MHQVLRETGLLPHCLELELTKTVMIKNADGNLALLYELKYFGIWIASDNFGSDYSSLSYLQKFPVDTLKIDPSFVAAIALESNDNILANAVIGLGKNLR